MSQTGYNAAGGTITTQISNGVMYNVHRFAQSGTFTPNGNFPVEYLVVAGGGSGGGDNAADGGGGAGGFLTGNISPTGNAVYTVVVGAGGATNSSGQASSVAGTGITTINSVGGGRGGRFVVWNGGEPGQAGGSGGGGSGNYFSSQAGGAGTAGQGNNGGASATFGNGTYKGGGGGGAANAGNASFGNEAGNGGNGREWPIGSGVFYAGGGGGGSIQESQATIGGTGGQGGGGLGIRGGGAGTARAATAGAVSTGGGGGGGAAGTGGSGIVILRYVVNTNPLVQSITAPETVVGVGSTFTISITSTAANNTNIPYQLSGVTSADINGASLTGNFTVVGGTASIQITTVSVQPPTNKTLTIVVDGSVRTVTISYLASNTQPSTGGTSSYSNAIREFVPIKLSTANAVSTTGALTYSSIRPTLVNATVLQWTPSIAVANSLSTTGALTYSSIRPILTGVVSLSMAPARDNSVAPAAPVTRQILIR